MGALFVALHSEWSVATLRGRENACVAWGFGSWGLPSDVSFVTRGEVMSTATQQASRNTGYPSDSQTGRSAGNGSDPQQGGPLRGARAGYLQPAPVFTSSHQSTFTKERN